MSRYKLSLVIALVLLLADSADAPPPPPPITLPGAVNGRVGTRWLAPYVIATTERVGSRWTTSVRWFDADGKVVRELSGPRVDAHAGYVSDYTNGVETIYAVNGDWKLSLPKKVGPSGYITATPDNRTFVHEFHPQQGQIAVDVYVNGRLVNTIGPFMQYLGRDVQVGADGSLAFLAWKDKKDEMVEVIVAGPDGKISFRAECEGPVDSPIVAPGGGGVLVRLNLPGNGHETFIFYKKSGKMSSLRLGPNPTFLNWLPESSKSLFTTSVGYKHRYQLIDWDSGKILWDVADPASGLWERAVPRRAVLGDYVLLCGLEFMKLGEREGPVRSIYALSLANGQAVAHWLPVPNCHFSTDWGWFRRLDSKVFLIWGKEFAEIKLSDIAARKNGWRTPK